MAVNQEPYFLDPQPTPLDIAVASLRIWCMDTTASATMVAAVTLVLDELATASKAAKLHERLAATHVTAWAAADRSACRAWKQRANLRNRIEDLKARVAAVGKVLEHNGCDCECGHAADDHDDDCERCLACCVSEALGDQL